MVKNTYRNETFSLLFKKLGSLLGLRARTLESGKYADLVVVNGDPQENIVMLQEESSIDMVMKGGEIVNRHL